MRQPVDSLDSWDETPHTAVSRAARHSSSGMEINWTALHVTAWSVVIIGVAGLIVADRRQRIEPNSRKHSKIPTLTEGAAELGASIDEAVGGFDSLLANFVERLSIVAREIGRVANRLRSAIADSRRPVHLNTPDEMKAPLLRASRTALWMSLILLGIGRRLGEGERL
jgi:hypothetical protein